MSKYYDVIVDTKDALSSVFGTEYNSWNNPINIDDFAHRMFIYHSHITRIADKIAFVATLQLCTFVIGRYGDIEYVRLPRTADVLHYINNGFKRMYRKKRKICFHLEDSWFPEEDTGFSARIL